MTPENNGNSAKPQLKVLLCSPRGFCAGVVRAIDSVEQALKRYGAPLGLSLLGPPGSDRALIAMAEKLATAWPGCAGPMCDMAATQ